MRTRSIETYTQLWPMRSTFKRHGSELEANACLRWWLKNKMHKNLASAGRTGGEVELCMNQIKLWGHMISHVGDI